MRICFFGDSFVNGTGDDDCLGWPGRLMARERQNGRDVTVYNLGVRRDTSGDIKNRWQDEALRRLAPGYAHRLAFSFGSNDCTVADDGNMRLTQAQSLANAEAILRQASLLAPTVMIGPPLVLVDREADARVKALSDALGRLCQDIGVPFLETCSFVASLAIWKAEAAAGDGTHPNRGGYSALAAYIATWHIWPLWLGSPSV